MSLIKDISVDNFKQEVLEDEQLMLVDFHTDGYGPCEVMEPGMQELAEQDRGKLKIVKFFVSLDEVLENSNEVAVEYDVMGLPTILLAKDQKVVNTLLGGQLKEDLIKEIEVAL